MEKPLQHNEYNPPPWVVADPVKLRQWREYWNRIQHDEMLDREEEIRKRRDDPRTRRGRRYD